MRVDLPSAPESLETPENAPAADEAQKSEALQPLAKSSDVLGTPLRVEEQQDPGESQQDPGEFHVGFAYTGMADAMATNPAVCGIMLFAIAFLLFIGKSL